MKTTLITGGTLVSAGSEQQADILIEDGVIRSIGNLPQAKNQEIIDASGFLIFPGLIDCHVHFREPGLEHKETMATGSAAALAGGVTAVCEMPNTIPPTVTIAALADKVRRAKDSKIDIRFFFGATEIAHLHTFRELYTGSSEELRRLKARCCGLKLYFDHSTGDQGAGVNVIEEAFKLCAELNVPVVCHCEDSKMNHELRIMNERALSGRSKTGSRRGNISMHSKIRPPESEAKAIKDALALAKKYGTHLHVAHLSTMQGIELVRAAKKSGVSVTCEVTPHHLFLTVDDYPSLGTLAKMNPPLRTKEHQEALWWGIEDGTVDCISTDHAPHTLEEKKSADPFKAPSGVPGVETMLPLLLQKLSPSQIIRFCFANPNHIFSLGKQGMAEGVHADLVLVDPKVRWVIRGKELHSKCGWTPYEGWPVQGKIVQVIAA